MLASAPMHVCLRPHTCKILMSRMKALSSAHEASHLLVPRHTTTTTTTQWLPASRCYSTLRFSRNMEFFSAGDAPIPKIKDSLSVCSSLDPSEKRPLTILLCWLMSKDRYVKKYATFYNDLGFDVLKVRVSPFDVMRPKKGSQVVASQMLEFLHQNPQHNQILVHGFSAGCYVFCEGLVQATADLDKHLPVLNRVVGQIWDSGVDIYALPEGIAKAITDNETIRASIKKYLQWFLSTQYDSATVYYERASVAMNEAYLPTPALFLYSDTDTISDPAMNSYVFNNWAKKGIKVYERCFRGSPHVSHFMKHPTEYREEVLAFLTSLGLLSLAHQRVAHQRLAL